MGNYNYIIIVDNVLEDYVSSYEKCIILNNCLYINAFVHKIKCIKLVDTLFVII